MDEETWRQKLVPFFHLHCPDCRKCMLEARPFSGRGKFRCVSRSTQKSCASTAKSDVDWIFGVGCTLASFGFFAICTSRDDGNGPGHYRPTQHNRTDTDLDDHLGVHFGISLQLCASGSLFVPSCRIFSRSLALREFLRRFHDRRELLALSLIHI